MDNNRFQGRASNMPQSVRVVLADDHDLVRSGIKALLRMIDGVQVVAEARDLSDAPRVMIPRDGGCWHEHRRP